jgi:hypothetical protein
MENDKKKEFDTLGFSELMKRPKPDLCDYVLALRETPVDVVKYDTVVINPYHKNEYHPDFAAVEHEHPELHVDPQKKRRGRKKKHS